MLEKNTSKRIDPLRGIADRIAELTGQEISFLQMEVAVNFSIKFHPFTKLNFHFLQKSTKGNYFVWEFTLERVKDFIISNLEKL